MAPCNLYTSGDRIFRREYVSHVQKKESGIITPSAEDILNPRYPFNQGRTIRERGEPPMIGRCDSRMGEILLQSLLVDGIFTPEEHPCHLDFFRQFLSPFGIMVHEVDMQILEKTTLAGDEVVIGSFYLRFDKAGTPSCEKVAAQGLFTARSNKDDTQVKFTSSTYQFKVHLKGQDPPAAVLSQNKQIIELEPIPLHSSQ